MPASQQQSNLCVQDQWWDDRQRTEDWQEPQDEAAARLTPFVPQARPGCRLPHCALQPLDHKDWLSSLDISTGALAADSAGRGPCWTLWGSGCWDWAAEWMRSAADSAHGPPEVVQLWVHTSASQTQTPVFPSGVQGVQDAQARWQQVMADTGPGLLLLVRPDGHIAVRLAKGPQSELPPEQQHRVWMAIWQTLLAHRT